MAANAMISENTPVKFTLSKTVAGILAIFLAGWGAYGTHQAAVASIASEVKSEIAGVREERARILTNYPTWSDTRKLREEDFRYWDSRLDELKDLIQKR